MEDMRRHEVRELAGLTARLDAAQQIFFQAEYSRHRRSPTTALLLCLLLGAFGAHYLYFGRTRAGLLRLAFCWTLVPLVMALIEAPTMEARAYRYNASLANELLLAIKGAVEAEAGQMATLVEADRATQVEGVAEPTAIAAPPMGAEAALIAAAWAGREPASDDPTDPPITLEELAPLALTGTAAAAASLAANGHTPAGAARAPFTWEPLTTEHAHGQADHSATNGSLDGHGSWQPWAAAEPENPTSVDLPLPVEAAHAEIAHADAPEPMGAPDGAAHWTVPTREEAPTEPWFQSLANPDLAATPSLPLSEPIGNGASAADAASDHLVSAFGGAADEDEPFPWFLADAHPAVAEAAASAAAVWATEDEPIEEPPHSVAPPSLVPLHGSDASAGLSDLPAWVHGQKESASDASEAAPGEREPVFMYQVAPAPRRESVRYGPPPDEQAAGTATSDGQALAGGGEEAGLAALGSVLAAGLADLLKDRSGRSRTVKLTTPLDDDEFAPHRFAPHAEPLSPVAPQPHPRDEPMADAVWAPLNASAPVAEPVQKAEPPQTQADDNASAPLVVAPLVDAGTGADDQAPWIPAGKAPADTNAPFAPAVYASPISRNTRRRTVQRVIVRKMAMLDGQVVAESSVERQVPLVGDDAEMAERLKTATTDAAREALSNLMKEAPEEALPAIRMQLYALDSATFVQRSH